MRRLPGSRLDYEPLVEAPNRVATARPQDRLGVRIGGRAFAALASVGLAAVLAGCGGGTEGTPGGSDDPARPSAVSGSEPAAGPAGSTTEAMPAAPALARWTGDLDGMLERRQIRALVVPARTQYWLDQGEQSGAEYELLKAFEEQINKEHPTGKKHVKIHVVFIPTSRDDLIPALLEGRGDLAAGILTITPERQEQVDFGAPFFRDVLEIAVTGPQSPALASVDDLSGQEVFVRRSSSYWSHLEALSKKFEQAGRAPIRLREAPEELQDDDLLEMLNAGLFGIAVVDRYKAKLWAQVLPNLRPHEDVVVNSGGEIAWMLRKGSPQLKAAVDAFAKTHGKGSAFGNTIVKKYTGSNRFVKNATSEAELAKFIRMIELFKKYGAQYDLDAILMAAQGYQESRLDQDAKSHVGAIGVMQIMPATGKELAVGDIQQLEPNIHGGVKYIRFMIDRYYADEPMTKLNKGLFAFASYNAGPARIRGLRKEAAARGLDPNKWFNNVELVAAEKIGSETVTYVANIFKYYVAYKLVMENREAVRAAKESVPARN